MNAAGQSLIILTPGFPENEEDSACLPWMQNFIRNLHQQYPLVSLTIISLQYPHKKGEYRWFGIPVIALGGKNKGGLATYFLRNRLSSLLKRLYKTNSCSGLLSFWYGECARSAELFAKKKKLLHYCWIAGQDAKTGNPYPAKVGISSDRLIAVSDFIQDHFEQNHGVKPAHVIPFGTDTSLFASNLPVKDIDLLAVGSLIPLKQYEVFIEAVSVIKEKMPNVKAVLIGKGPEERKLKELIEKYKLSDTITLTGELPYQAVLQYMQRAKVFLHPSSYEGFGCVCTEALFAGAFVIRFTRPMKKDMTNTFVVRTKEEMISNTLQLLLENKTGRPVNEYPVEETVKKAATLFKL